LIQTIGRAARNVNGKVILYADKETMSIRNAMNITAKRREMQIEFNKKNKITPMTIIKKIADKKYEVRGIKHMSAHDVEKKIADLDAEMRIAAEKLDFEKAIEIRDTLDAMKKELMVENSSKEYHRNKKSK
jgi:excinuclease ABC subunit B